MRRLHQRRRMRLAIYEALIDFQPVALERSFRGVLTDRYMAFLLDFLLRLLVATLGDRYLAGY